MNTENTKTSSKSFSPVALRWLQWQCKMISAVKIGAVFLKADDPKRHLEMSAVWHNQSCESVDSELYDIALNVYTGSKVSSKINCTIENTSMICDIVTLPLTNNDGISGVVVFLQAPRSYDQKNAIYQLYQWGCSWLESSLMVSEEEDNKQNPLVNTLSSLALNDVSLAVSTHEICNFLETEFNCKRVSLGLMRGLQVETLALSNQLRFSKKSSSLRDMETAMEEAIDQKETIHCPHKNNQLSTVTQKHRSLSVKNDNAQVLSVPFKINDEDMGSILLIKNDANPFSENEIKILEYAVINLGKVIGLKLELESSMTKIMLTKIRKGTASLLGKNNLIIKVASLVFLISIAILSVFKVDYYVYASATLEGEITQVIVAPQDSFIKSASVRAGDLVQKDQKIVIFDDKDVILEHESLLSKRGKILKEYQESLALQQRSKISIFLAQISQVDAELSLVKEKLKRSNILSPLSGIVVSGDLSHSFGTPVEKGQELFKISPLGNYRVALDIDDADVAKLRNEQQGSLRLIGLPFGRLLINISKITPISMPKDGGNFFRVEAMIQGVNEEMLRPGMKGIAKIKISEENVLWVWTHTIVEKTRLWLWSMGI